MDNVSGKQKVVFASCILLTTCIILFAGYIDKTPLYQKFNYLMQLPYWNTTVPISGCPDVAVGITRGKWKTRPLTPEEEREVGSFLETVRTGHNMPKSMQRKDGKCGNAPYSHWFRAICNPKGATPCCYNGKCVNRTVDECKCPNCYDLRSQIHAEYSTWIPEDHRCSVKIYTSKEACDLLQEIKLVVVGNSLMRHLYIAFLLLLSNSEYDKIWDSKFPKDQRKNCTGMQLFGERRCRWALRKWASLCGGNTSVALVYRYRIAHKAVFHNYVRTRLNNKNTYFLVSVGAHDNFNKSVYKEFVLPAIKIINKNNSTWPKIIWVTNHYFGILKTYAVPEQGNARVKEYNNFMVENLRKHNVPILDTFNLTAGVMSPDGAHYGVGVNIMKAQLFLNLLKHLKNEDKL